MTDLLDLVYEHDELADLDPAQRRLALRSIVADAGVSDMAGAVATLADEIDGLGPLAELMRDDDVTDVLVNGPSEVWVERHGRLTRTECRFATAERLTSWCERVVTAAGGRLDVAAPVADVRLADGSRLHAVLPPIAPHGPLVSIRRVARRPLSLDDLVDLGCMSRDDADGLAGHVRERRSIAIAGATGAGKTTLLNALLSIVPATERVVVIEELPELRPTGIHAVSMVARQPNAEGRGDIDMEALVRASLRMRPDRIVIGEVRGPEALPALWAMSTGHAGSMLSVHASSAADAVARLVDLALRAAGAPSEDSLRRAIAHAIDLVVHLERRNGRRRVSEIRVLG